MEGTHRLVSQVSFGKGAADRFGKGVSRNNGGGPFHSFRILDSSFIIILILLLVCPTYASDTIALTILHTNDIHGHAAPFDYDGLGEKETNAGGAAARKAVIGRIKNKAGHGVLVMDAGDAFDRGAAPDFAAMRAAECDVMTLGNSEFKGKGGVATLKSRIKQAGFPIVLANVLDKATGATLVPPYHVFKRSGIRVGVFGLTTLTVADYPEAAGLKVADPIETAKRIVAEIEPKCDLIVALTHIGYPYDLQLAAAVPEIDIIIGGHTHTWIFQPQIYKSGADSTVICQAGEYGVRVGRLDLSLRRISKHRCRVESCSGELVF